MGSLSSDSGVMSSREDHTASESDGQSENASSCASSSTYRNVCAPYPLITDCTRCMYKYEYLREAINAHLPSVWKWSIRRTRWPIRIAPQQNVDLSMAGIRTPPWRASSGRMMLDVCLLREQPRHDKSRTPRSHGEWQFYLGVRLLL